MITNKSRLTIVIKHLANKVDIVARRINLKGDVEKPSYVGGRRMIWGKDE